MLSKIENTVECCTLGAPAKLAYTEERCHKVTSSTIGKLTLVEQLSEAQQREVSSIRQRMTRVLPRCINVCDVGNVAQHIEWKIEQTNWRLIHTVHRVVGSGNRPSRARESRITPEQRRDTCVEQATLQGL